MSIGVVGLELRVNSLGDAVCRPGYLQELRNFLRDRSSELCDDSLGLIERSPMRVLDCKTCSPHLSDAPKMAEFLCGPCQEHHDSVLKGLETLGIEYVADPSLVRGLDYYTRTAFEYIGTDLDAAQNAVGGGGRYDGLAESLGGRPAPGVGFALGLDRAILAIDASQENDLEIYVVSESTPFDVLHLVSDLRAEGWATDFDASGRSAKAQFKSAAKSGAPITLIFHSADEPVSIRSGEERHEVPISEVTSWLGSRQ